MNRAELKSIAKMRIRQAEPSCWKVMLLWLLAALAVPAAAIIAVLGSGFGLFRFFAQVIGGIDPEVAVHSLELSTPWIVAVIVVYILLLIYQNIINFGLNAYCLSLYRGEEGGPGELFCGFSIAGRVIGAQLLAGLFMFGLLLLTTLALGLISLLLSQMSEVLAMLLSVPLVLGCYAVMIAIVLRYALLNFVLADRPELGALETVRTAKQLMKGHIFEYFVLNLSFIGWFFAVWLGTYFLALVMVVVVAGAGGGMGLAVAAVVLLSLAVMLAVCLWLTPYMGVTAAGYYDLLCGQENAQFQPWTP